MGTILIRLVILFVVWTVFSSGIAYVLRACGHVADWITPFVALVIVGAALSAATAIGLGYFEQHYL